MTKKQSPQALAKLEQGFRKTPDSCENCKHFSKRVEEKSYKSWNGRVMHWTVDKSLRCNVGDFATLKRATCNKHELVTA
ncbi:hypothetical protein [Cupriavidus sp. DL-D2]|uniref:hypothetical protein n=1 Tax=Cupriavidus sp. DL-D2 TaxID=3144974 RepID=UPI00321217BB